MPLLTRTAWASSWPHCSGGRPALQWGHALAQAVRVSTGMMDGYLAVPPFPYAVAAP